ncbi:MAG TPA: hypothetical protein VN861_01760 [Candidatus Acidoferrales bacterium]|nr:hypothetical protein [Candidatus Acidoferrales bacterium]
MKTCYKFQVLRSGRFFAFVALLGLGLLFTTSGAKAGGCAVGYKAGATAPSIPFVSPQGNGHQEDEDFDGHAIVGLWHVIYTATESTSGRLPVPVIPPGPPSSFQFLESFKTWHADRTEFENAFLPPAAGNICFGVWKDVGEGRVKLHHIGLMFAPDGSISNIFTVDETDAVASNDKSYKGNFDFKLWPPSFDLVGVGTPVQEIKGTTAATRITVD